MVASQRQITVCSSVWRPLDRNGINVDQFLATCSERSPSAGKHKDCLDRQLTRILALCTPVSSRTQHMQDPVQKGSVQTVGVLRV